MSDTREKKQDPSPKVKELLTGFEKGSLQINAAKYDRENPVARPGGAKKLTQQFEHLSEPAPAPELVRRSPKSPTSPSPQSPIPATNGESQAEQPTATAEPSTPADAPEPQAQSEPKAAKPTESPLKAEPAPSQTNAEPTPSQTSAEPAPSKVETTQSQPKPEPAPAKTAAIKQNVLIVYADMERQGFNGEVLDTTVNKLESQGHTVVVSDLYRSKFNPLPTRFDAGVSDNGGNFLYEESMLTANLNNKVSSDIKAEQDKVKAADLVIFIFRFLPSGVPPMLQGYLNRVLSEGFAADFTSKAIFDQGKLKGKKALLCMSCLLNADNFSKNFEFQELDRYLWPVQYGTLRYSGFDVLVPQMNDDYFYGGDSQQQILLKDWNKRLDTIQTEATLNFA